MFHLLKTVRDHVYFAILFIVSFATELERGDTTLILEVSKGENLVKLNFS